MTLGMKMRLADRESFEKMILLETNQLIDLVTDDCNAFLIETYQGIFSNSFCTQKAVDLGGSPGLVVMGGDSCSEGCGFESQLFILD